MKETYDNLESGTLKRKNKDHERGIVATPLISCIEPTDWLFPPLHALDLLTNTPFSYMRKWVWNRLEVVPLKLIDQRDARTRAALEMETVWDDLIEAEEYALFMKEELCLLLPDTTNGTAVNDSTFDDDAHAQEYTNQKAVVAEAESNVATLKALHEEKKKA